MLVLTRFASESLVIGDGRDKVVVTIKSVKGGRVQLAIDAPRHIPIHRHEVYDNLKANAATDSHDSVISLAKPGE